MATEKIIKIRVDTSKAVKSTDKLKDSLNEVSKTTVKTKNSTNKFSEGINAGFGAMPAGIQGAISSLRDFKVALISTGVGAIVVALGALTALFVSANRKGAAFGKALSGLKAVTGATSKELEVLTSQSKILGRTTQFTAKEVISLQTELAKLGFSVRDIEKSTPAILDLSASLGVDLANAATFAGSVVRSFGLDTSETQRVVDIMALSTTKSALNFNSLSESMKLTIPTAKALGIPVERVTALLGVLADRGLKGSIAGTGLSKTFIELNKKGLTLEQSFEKINKSTNKLNTAIDLVGVIGAKSLLNLADAGDEIGGLEEQFDNAAGAAKRIAETRLDNLAGDVTKLASAWEGFLLGIEDGEGIFNSISRGIIKATTAIFDFIAPNKSLTEGLENQRFALFKSESQLDSFDKKIKNTETSEIDLAKAQRGRLKVINELQVKYPDFLSNIDSETISTNELKKAIKEVNNSLINKILIQEKQEEIQQQAIESADALKDKFENEKKVLQEITTLRKKYSDLGIEIKSTSPNDVIKELNEISIKQNELRLAGNKGFVLGANGLNDLRKETVRLSINTDVLNKSNKNFNDEQEKGNRLLEGKKELMKKLGIQEKEDSEIVTVETVEPEKTDEETTEEEAAAARAAAKENKRLEAIDKIREKFKRKNEDLEDEDYLAKLERQYDRDLIELERLDATEQQKYELRKYYNGLISTEEQKISQDFADSQEKVKTDAEDQRLKEAEDQIKLEQSVSDAKNNIANRTANLLMALGGKAAKVGKAIAVAQTIRSGIEGVQNAYSTAQKSPITALFPAYPIAQAGLAGAFSALQVKKILSTPETGGGGGANNSRGGETGAPSFNLVQGTQQDQLQQSINASNDRPLQAIVVSSSVTNAQQANRNKYEESSI